MQTIVKDLKEYVIKEDEKRMKRLRTLCLLSILLSANLSPVSALADEVLVAESHQQTDSTSTVAGASSELAATPSATTQTTVGLDQASAPLEESQTNTTEASAASQPSDSENPSSSVPASDTPAPDTSAPSESQPSSETTPSGETADGSLPSSGQEVNPPASPESSAPVGDTAQSSSAVSAVTANPAPITGAFDHRLDSDDEDSNKRLYGGYVEHWSGDDAYSHNLLYHRYGVTAEQLDGFLQETGIAYDKERINGDLLLKWEQESGLDVRAIVAIAIAESSLGTAGVATLPGANMFGYAAFDSNPDNATKYSDEVAIKKLTRETIIANRNLTFKRQDEKAQQNAAGQLDVASEGGVYFTDTSGSGERRAKIMTALDEWIDDHGGTPEIPEELRNFNVTNLAAVPEGYSLSVAANPATYLAQTYPWGECTWYVYNRARELGYQFDPYMGNGGDWQFKPGYDITHTPQVGAAVSFAPGQAGADATYGHVAIVEQVKSDGSILISESNALGRGIISYRTFTPLQAQQLTYVIGKE